MHQNPSWIIVSQEAAADIGYEALIPAVVLTALALVTVAFRWYSRVKLSGTYGVEDVVITLALVCAVLNSKSRVLTAEDTIDNLCRPCGRR